MVPYWSKDGKTGFINARAERIDTAPAFRRPFHKRGCLIPANGFYEWKKTPEGKIPYSIEMKDASPFVFAGLWDGWQNPEYQRVVAKLRNHYRRTKRIGRPNSQSDACHSAAGDP